MDEILDLNVNYQAMRLKHFDLRLAMPDKSYFIAKIIFFPKTKLLRGVTVLQLRQYVNMFVCEHNEHYRYNLL